MPAPWLKNIWGAPWSVKGLWLWGQPPHFDPTLDLHDVGPDFGLGSG